MIYGYASMGYEGVMVYIEVDMSNSIPGLEIIGLPASEVKEARERVKIALRSSGFRWPSKRILINLSPAAIRKKGSGFDLPIALAILECTGQIALPHSAEGIMGFGELQFNGKVRPVPFGLSAVSCGISNNVHNFIAAKENEREIFAFSTSTCYCIEHLHQLKQHTVQFRKNTESSLDIPPFYVDDHIPKEGSTHDEALTLCTLSHCDELKRIIQIVATGRHNLYLCGPPGTGKTAAAIRMPSLLPELSYEESLEVSRIYSCAHAVDSRGITYPSSRDVLIHKRPIRMPHHTASVEGIIGSISHATPGEISLAHTGLLILDEAPEFKMQVLQSLREPMDTHKVHISRAGKKWECPSDFQLILTSNLCPCGNLGKSQNSGQWCLCNEREIFQYWKRIGGAIWDRIDIKYRTSMSDIPYRESRKSRHEHMNSMLREVHSALEMQRARKPHGKFLWNSRYSHEDIENKCNISFNARKVIQQVNKNSGGSERGRIILSRVSRTIADLDGSESIRAHHIEEALQITAFMNPTHAIQKMLEEIHAIQ